MDIAVLLITMFFCFLIGVPIAYSLALAAIAGAFWIGIPLEAVMLKISDGVSKVAMLTIPFFVLAGAIMAEGGMARRLVAFADVLVGFTRVRGGLSVVNVLATDVSQRHLRLGGGRHLRDRLGDDPADGEERISARVRDQRDDHRLGAGTAGAAEPQRGDLFARHRRHHLDHQPVHGRRRARPAARPLAGHSVCWSSPIATAIRADRLSPLRKPSRSRSTRRGA